MLKKVLVALLSISLTLVVVGCSNSNKNEIQENPQKVETKKEETFIGDGTWTKDYTREEVIAFNEEISPRIEEEANFYGMEYNKEEIVKEEKGETVNDNSIYFDNLNPEPNKIESMYYGMKIYGSDLSKGSLNLKIGLKLDIDQIKEEDKFDLKETTISNFSEAMTNDIERDYTEINEKIIEIVKNQNSNGKIESNLDGLVETITINEDYILYKLDSKVYKFK
ncbi:hypothetical protein [Clostridium sp.]|uniref:hypothetical protein n=1 Tax=Clostridium sp. TaxID=1506 RepID=UPI00262EB1B5|nr:hypothetical protein [Clostridium sp.]